MRFALLNRQSSSRFDAWFTMQATDRLKHKRIWLVDAERGFDTLHHSQHT
jgi:hypothetical protein